MSSGVGSVKTSSSSGYSNVCSREWYIILTDNNNNNRKNNNAPILNSIFINRYTNYHKPNPTIYPKMETAKMSHS